MAVWKRDREEWGPGRCVVFRAPLAFEMHDLLRQFVLYWLPLILWMGVIFGFSTEHFSGASTGSVFEGLMSQLFPSLATEWIVGLHLLLRKLGHVTEYAILAILWARALFQSGPWRGALGRARLFWILGFVVLYAASDEWHQSWSSQRTGSVLDVLLDGAGGAGGLVLWSLSRRWDKQKKLSRAN